MVTSTDCNNKPIETENRERIDDDRASLLYSTWSVMLSKSRNEENEYLQKHGISESNLPNAPHLEDCKAKQRLYERLDKRAGNQSFPPWTTWKGFLDTHPVAFRHQAASDGAYPPWVCMYICMYVSYNLFSNIFFFFKYTVE